jgi:Ca-activated chloride channel family protein
MANQERDVADVTVSYANMETKTTDRLASSVAVRFSASQEQVAKRCDKDVMEDAVMQVATERNAIATKLRDEGKQKEAQKLLLFNASYLREQGGKLESDKLIKYAGENVGDSRNLDAKMWNVRRKSMRSMQHKVKSQQSY